ncbi:MFS general substrate transporter [Gonapodya prolifera JEL478]|uniref:MFS general substrate transporter n=1 Tax=Gonapodya prolifera (strain JEL478) TaxID=1344416 RepID=A0A139ARX7_GONPJ|nr:MFS general substrate transporter [Gonapodya prolifera JEL478]|eukprot:KXS19293.1 MFS general substrate transporter [Gonapodya prolifera JEL478]
MEKPSHANTIAEPPKPSTPPGTAKSEDLDDTETSALPLSVSGRDETQLLQKDTETSPREHPKLASIFASRSYALACASFAMGTDFFLYSIVIPVLPFAVGVIDGTCPAGSKECPDDPQLGLILGALIGAYFGVVVLLAPAAGWISDRLRTRRKLVLIGFLALGASTVFFALSSSLAMLFLARICQGVSASASWACSMALIADVYPPELLGRAMGTAQLVFGMMQLAGPPLGGIIYDHLGYPAVFILCGTLVAVNIIAWGLYRERPLDTGAKATLTSATDDSVDESGESKISATPAPTSPQTMWHVLSSWRVWVMLWMAFLSGLELTVYEPTLPAHLKINLGQSSSITGLVFLVWIVPNTLAAPAVGWARDKWGSKWLLLSGAALSIIAFPAVGAPLSLGGLCGVLVPLGLVMPLVMTPVMPEMSMLCEPHLTGQMYSAWNSAFSAGSTLGPIIAGLLYSKFGLLSVGVAMAVASALTLPLLWAYYYRRNVR